MRICADIDGDAVVSTTELSKRLGLYVPASFLIRLGLKPHTILPNGHVYWATDQITNIRLTLANFIKGES